MGTRDFYPKNFFFFVPGLQWVRRGWRRIGGASRGPAPSDNVYIRFRKHSPGIDRGHPGLDLCYSFRIAEFKRFS
jgi:hypothetical protein